ncbi:hypothetical protein [Pseudomonas amygdali]|uniref:hypothetical protein n=1 Tax=Pseudomonas amygdali TaxID=47877 RepID=UPI0016054EAC
MAAQQTQHPTVECYRPRTTPTRLERFAQIETPINATQKVIGGDVVFKVERVKQPFLPTR